MKIPSTIALNLPRGFVLDGAVFLFNLLLAGALSRLVAENRGFHPIFGLALFAAIFAYAAGAGLKRLPLQARLQAPGRPKLPTAMAVVFFCLAVMHLALFMAGASFGIEAILGETAGKRWLLPATIAGLLPTVALVFSLVPPRRPPPEPDRLAARELAADLLLYLALVVLMVWWDGFWADYLAGGKQANLWLNLLLVVLTTVPFALFYLSPRLLFLIEDWRSPATWFRAFLVMLPLARHLLL